MQYEVFAVPVLGGEEAMERLNRFLRGHKVVQVDKELVRMGECAYWSFCITYLLSNTPSGAPLFPSPAERKEKIDYKEVLDANHFKVFSQLRMIRKRIAEEDAVPAYAVFTDAELAALSRLDNLTEQEMLKVEGIGKKKVEKYGSSLVSMMQKEGFFHKEGLETGAENTL